MKTTVNPILAEFRAPITAQELIHLMAVNAELVAALQDAEFLMRQAGKIPGPIQDSFNRSAQDARAALDKAQS